MQALKIVSCLCSEIEQNYQRTANIQLKSKNHRHSLGKMKKNCVYDVNQYFSFIIIKFSLIKSWNLRVKSVVYTGFRGWGGVPGAMGRYIFTLEKAQISRFFKLENFQKIKKQWKCYNCLKTFKEILRFFEIFLKFYRNIRENLGKKLENMDF